MSDWSLYEEILTMILQLKYGMIHMALEEKVAFLVCWISFGYTRYQQYLYCLDIATGLVYRESCKHLALDGLAYTHRNLSASDQVKLFDDLLAFS